MKLLRFLALLLPLSDTPTWETGNALAKQYSAWAQLRNARVEDPAKSGTLSLPELREWQKVKTAWRQLERQVEREYSGQ